MRFTIGLLGTTVFDVELTKSNVVRLDELETEADEADDDKPGPKTGFFAK